MGDTDQLVDEICQIVAQYKKEVPQKGRAWPASIRERVKALSRLDISNGEIAARTGIPVPTIYIWTSGKAFPKKAKSKEKSNFLPVQIVQKNQEGNQKSSILTANGDQKRTSEGTLYSVTLPGGIRVEQLSLDALVELSRRMST